MVTLIDAHYFGNELRRARKSARLNLSETANLLHIDRRDLLRFEVGAKVMPPAVVHRLFHFGLVVLKTHAEKPKKKPSAPKE